MTVEELKAAYVSLPSKVIKGRSDHFLRIEENKPTTLFILVGGSDSFPDTAADGYSSKGIWVHPIGTHFLGRRIGCTNLSNPNSCFICEQVRELEAKFTALKQDRDEVTKSDPDEGNKMLLQVQECEKQLQSIRCQERYAINVLVKGQDIPVVYEAPKSVAEPIYQMFETALTEDGFNIFDPLQAIAFTISKAGKGLATKYSVTPSPRPLSIITGERQDERIKKALLAAANFDEKYKIPTRTEQVTAWDAYRNTPTQHQAQSGVSFAESNRRKSAGPALMSHIGEKEVPHKAKAVAVEQPLESQPETDGVDYGNRNGNGESEPAEQELEIMRKERSAAVVSKLLTRLRTAQSC
jgi:gp32 DNA binding protein like